MASSFKKIKAKIDLLTDIDVINGRKSYYYIYQYAKANNNYMKNYDKSKESSDIQDWDVNNLYGWAMSQNLPVNIFEWIEDTSQFNKDFINNYNEESDNK